MSLRAGRLNRKISIYEIVETEIDQAGQPIKSRSLKKTIYAAIIPVSGREKMQSGRENLAAMMCKLLMRFDPEISVQDEIEFDGYYWRVISFSPGGRMLKEDLELIVEVLEVSTVEKTS